MTRSIPSPIVSLGILLIAVILALTVLGPWIAPYDPMQMAVGRRLAAPDAAHWLGTDQFGRDLASRVLDGARYTVGIGAAAVAFGIVVGSIIGTFAAFGGRFMQSAMLRVVDVLYSFPDTLVALAIVAFLGPNVENATLAIALSLVPFYARVSFGLAAVERARPYVEAAQLGGAGRLRVILVHVLPNVGQPLLVLSIIGFSSAILSAAGLSFLGLGVQPPTPEWGALLSAGRDYMLRAPSILLGPGLAICITVLAFNIVGDSMRDLLDPRHRSSR